MAREGESDNALVLAQLRRDEGAVRDREGRHLAYRCPAGKLTIGYGHNLDAWPIPGMVEGSVMVEQDALVLLEKDVNQVKAQVKQRFPWSVTLDFPRFAVLVNMAFNLGVGGLGAFTKTLQAVENGDYAGAARRMLVSIWAVQVGSRASRLSRQMETGQWQ